MRSWIRKLFTRPVSRTIRKVPRPGRLNLETLEDRCCPATWTVTNLLDDGSEGSLRWAVEQANTTGGPDDIKFGALFDTAQEITLEGTQLALIDFTGPTTIEGTAAGVTINGDSLSRVFQIDANVVVAMSNLTITGGHAIDDHGGGIWNEGDLTLTDCTVTGNTADLSGGGIYSVPAGGGKGSTLTLDGTTVEGNTAAKGGGVFNGGTATIDNSTISGNHAVGGFVYDESDPPVLTDVNGVGGGLVNAGTMTITDSTISGNTADFAGGGVLNGVPLAGSGKGGATTAVLDITGATIDGNTAGKGAGLWNSGEATLDDVTITNNHAVGGVVYGDPVTTGGGKGSTTTTTEPVTDVNGIGGGVLNSNLMVITNSTISGNTADFGGGGAINVGEPPAGSGKGSTAAAEATLTMTDTSVTGNAAGLAAGVLNTGAISASSGGGKGSTTTTTSSAALFMTDCIVSGNKALPGGGSAGPTFAGAGFGVVNMGSAELVRCTISGNDGGGVYNSGSLSAPVGTGGGKGSSGGGKGSSGTTTSSAATLTMSDTTVSGNLALAGSGLAIASDAGFGVVNKGSAILINSTISGHNGGGVYNSSPGVTSGGGKGSSTTGYGLTMTNCTVSENEGPAGGVFGVVNLGTALLTHCTISGNDAGLFAAGSSSGGGKGSSGGGKGSSGGGKGSTTTAATTTLSNTIVAGNTYADVDGTVSGNNNLIGNKGAGGLVDGEDGNIVGVAAADLFLGPLADNGGPTQTMALLPGSPAINAGAAVVYSHLTADVDATTDTITIASTTGLGIGLYIQIDSEIMRITAVIDGTNLEVARGQLGTTAAIHSVAAAATLSEEVVDNIDDTFEVYDSTNLVVGQYVAIDSEIVLIVAKDVNGTTVTVEREQLGTTGTMHSIDSPLVPYRRVFLAADQTGTAYVDAPDIGAYEFTEPADVSVAVAPASVREDEGTNLVFTFTRSNTGGPLTINFTVGGTAVFSSGDYTQTGADTFSDTAGTVTFAAGSSTAVVTITPTSDALLEGAETVVLTVVIGPRYNLASPTEATGTITDPEADLQVTKTDDETSVQPGAVITYTIVVTNAGPSAVTGASFSDLFPDTMLESISYVSNVTNGTVTGNSSGTDVTSIADLLDMSAGAVVEYTVTATVSAGVQGTLSNTATIAPPDGTLDPDESNNSAEDTTDVNAPPVIEDQSFTTTENRANGAVIGTVVASDPGQTLTYSITAGNTDGAFAIDEDTGEITVANSAALDFETNPVFTLTVEVSDGAHSASATITINLTNVFADHFDFSTWVDYSTNTGWSPQLVGDFDGDGLDDVANFLASNGGWYISLSTGTSFLQPLRWVDLANSGFTQHLVGDYNGDGKDDIASFYSPNGVWYVSISNGTSFTNSGWVDLASTGWTTQQVGDFNGDGKDDIASLYSNGVWYVSISTGTSFTNSSWNTVGTGWTRLLVGDFNGDGNDDVAGFRFSTGSWYVSLSTGTSFGPSTVWDAISASWVTQIVGDFNNDGMDDIAGLYSGDGIWYVSLSSGTDFTTVGWGPSVGTTNWTKHVVADFNGDGVDDISSFKNADGTWWTSVSDTTTFATTIWADLTDWGWSSPVHGNFNGDEFGDVAAFRTATGTWHVGLGAEPVNTLRLDRASIKPAADAFKLTQAQLDASVARAFSIFAGLGVNTNPLSGLSFVVADLAGNTLGLSGNNVVTIDVNAAGHGWSLDDTPDADDVDLLSVVLHEMGHELGLEHDDAAFMAGLIGLGERRLPTAEDVDELLAKVK